MLITVKYMKNVT